ncbi:hypothetical protein [Ruminococcus sp.]|uniref:hypothetical protein n=1 Tax=Ruminococcus sp. TaxID=41978 RepID=UPI0025E16F5D|nr:hypothetical protein [Ruminococcus sp.]MCR4639049.1 hypothetical protein [Ruminococcus sp.]
MPFPPVIIVFASVGVILAYFYHKGKKCEKRPVTYNQFIEQLSKQIDNYMINEEKKTGISMYGGECNIYITQESPDIVFMKIILYGKKKKDDNWTKSEILQKLNISDFTDDQDTQSKLEKIKMKPDNFKVSRPSKE